MSVSSLQGPFPSRRATDVLCNRLIERLQAEEPSVGDTFFTESQLVEVSGLSRFTVRRAMGRLSDEGWIERRAGKGTFVGPRVLMGKRPASQRVAKTNVRLAVLVYCLNDSMPDWYSSGVLQGIDEVAGDLSISIELMGQSTADLGNLARRLEQSRPDVLAVMPSGTWHAYMVREAQRLGIPCLLTGTRMLDLKLPTVYEDGAQGAAMAVKYLYEHGHRRIGLLQRPDSARWVFDRRRGYVAGVTECGLQHDERLVCWLDNDLGPDSSRALAAYLRREKPTALLLSSGFHMETLVRLVDTNGLKIPDDLSVVTFDQQYRINSQFMAVNFATVDLPLREMGRQLARLACDVVGQGSDDRQVQLPCTLTVGDSVQTLIA